MLTMELTTWDGRSYRLPVLLSWCLTYTGGVPCDSMTASCPYDKSMAEMLPDATRFTAFQDGEIMLRASLTPMRSPCPARGCWSIWKGGAWRHC